MNLVYFIILSKHNASLLIKLSMKVTQNKIELRRELSKFKGTTWRFEELLIYIMFDYVKKLEINR